MCKMNYLSRRIGVYYTDSEWRDKYFKELIENIPTESVNRIGNKNETFIELKDGSIIKFIRMNDGARANKVHEAFLQPGISYEKYCRIIAPCIICGGQGYFVNKLEDFYFRKETVKKYFNIQK